MLRGREAVQCTLDTSSEDGHCPATTRLGTPLRGYAAARPARISSSFLIASFVQSLAFRRRNLRSPSSLVRAAYHSHWRACSKHSSMVGDMVYLQPWPRAFSLFDQITQMLRSGCGADQRCAAKKKRPRGGLVAGSLLTRLLGWDPACIGAVRGVRVPSSHQQTDKASADTWFAPEHCKRCNAHLR